MSLASAAVLGFFVMSPLENIPFFLAALRHVSPAQHRKVIVRELLIALAIMIAFLFAGRYFLDLLPVSRASLTAADGVILLLIALRMIFPTTERPLLDDLPEEPFIVPLAIPATAGPSVLAAELVFMSQEPGRWPIWLAAVVIAWVAAAVILLLSINLRRLLGDRGLMALERLMGMVLVIVSVEMIMAGVAQYFERVTV